MFKEYDVIVVGGGPAGLHTGRKLSENGISVLILEEHSEIGTPVECAGGIEAHTFKDVDLKPKREWIKSEVRKIRFFSPKNTVVEIKSKRPLAYITDRREFDKYLGELALDSGAEIALKTKFTDARNSNRGLVIKTRGINGEEDFHARVVVAADGMKSTVGKKFSLDMRKEFYHCAEYEMIDVNHDKETAEIYFCNLARDGYAWIFPKGDRFNVGIGTANKGRNALYYLNKFVKEHPVASDKLKRAKILSQYTGIVSSSGPVKDTCTESLVAVGDAGGFTNPVSGGGIRTALITAEIAADVILDSIEGRVSLKEYESVWKSNLGNEFRSSLRTRKLIYSMNDTAIDLLFKAASRLNISRYVSDDNLIEKIASLANKLSVKDLFSLKSNKVR